MKYSFQNLTTMVLGRIPQNMKQYKHKTSSNPKHRKRFVTVNRVDPGTLPINYGVPQGPVLVLFSLFSFYLY